MTVELRQDIAKEAARYIALACNSFPKLVEMLQDALLRLGDWIGSDCECDNTHEANDTRCCLCEYRALLDRVEKGGE